MLFEFSDRSFVGLCLVVTKLQVKCHSVICSTKRPKTLQTQPALILLAYFDFEYNVTLVSSFILSILCIPLFAHLYFEYHVTHLSLFIS